MNSTLVSPQGAENGGPTEQASALAILLFPVPSVRPVRRDLPDPDLPFFVCFVSFVVMLLHLLTSPPPGTPPPMGVDGGTRARVLPAPVNPPPAYPPASTPPPGTPPPPSS